MVRNARQEDLVYTRDMIRVPHIARTLARCQEVHGTRMCECELRSSVGCRFQANEKSSATVLIWAHAKNKCFFHDVLASSPPRASVACRIVFPIKMFFFFVYRFNSPSVSHCAPCLLSLPRSSTSTPPLP